jgi:hypothetical protein
MGSARTEVVAVSVHTALCIDLIVKVTSVWHKHSIEEADKGWQESVLSSIRKRTHLFGRTKFCSLAGQGDKAECT